MIRITKKNMLEAIASGSALMKSKCENNQPTLMDLFGVKRSAIGPAIRGNREVCLAYDTRFNITTIRPKADECIILDDDYETATGSSVTIELDEQDLNDLAEAHVSNSTAHMGLEASQEEYSEFQA